MAVVFSGVLLAACATPLPAHPARSAPLWNDPDRHLFQDRPGKYYSGKYTDAVDQVALRPATQAFAFRASSEALNVNTLDEVPDSSWFMNRIGRHPFTPTQLASGPCTAPPLDPNTIWTVLSSKSDGIAPGFVIRDTEGRRYLLKFDEPGQGPRSTAADAIASRLYYAAGYTVPCNRVVFFSRETLALASDAEQTDWLGHDHPYELGDLEASLASAPRTADGRYRALASLWLDGKSLGPWRFSGTRSDDPNDIIDHEDRRELRSLRLLAAWTGHVDAREQNTLALWMDAGNGWGWVRHALLDFGDCFGKLQSPPMLARRLAGHAYGVDFGQIAADLLTFGVIERPFESERFGLSGSVFGYFSLERFDPERWRPSYPNPAFQRMTERDGAWMARILARFEPAYIERAIRAGRLGAPALRVELMRVLLGRRERILRRYLPGHSSLSTPVIADWAEGTALCSDDLAVIGGISTSHETSVEAILKRADSVPEALPVRTDRSRICVDLPKAAIAPAKPHELSVELRLVRSSEPREGQLRTLLLKDSSGYQIIALERRPTSPNR
jgi:hypothetical protein